MSKLQGVLLIVSAFVAGSLTWAIISTAQTSESLQDYRVFFRDENGSGLVHVTTTAQGDLWIYNAGAQEIYYIDNPKESKQINILKKKIEP
ncbi:hypothetical protein BAG01nite_35390 [Brevibacillus agri]|uniref:Uncharacterized protein n=1 Tax=Brevibacillus agri TaxID=51101 RepID=A0A3M8AX66_9BACL|nr:MULTISPECIES: hypothetical protein [Brevibacillus]ELK39792.1 hypothetical protein D478_22468 [Brevibacillus agri BAB-2500]EJL46024.1 hypothetical protein PMI08_01346 [Brevibacillus sp. CF112]MBG9566705.1 hypothetical protein [Brevibacillus agri]MBY0055200.1 hypothetical protein [Brevibacillus agri]MCG5251012.1 hypothetical protein [Brevibacillus agri]